MERLQFRSSDESMHLVTWVGLAGSLYCQYSVELSVKTSDISPKNVAIGHQGSQMVIPDVTWDDGWYAICGS